MKNIIYISFLFFFCTVQGQSQSFVDSLPSVFLIGEHEVEYNKMLAVQPDLLMSVCDSDMDLAYTNWLNFLMEVEQFSIEQGLDINGVKIWINVFWNADGTIKHIAFYPKPNSRNMEYSFVKALFSEFIKTYTSELKNDNIFCHYGSASFPSFITTSKQEEK